LGGLSPRFLAVATVFIAVAMAMSQAIADDDLELARQLRNTESILPLSQILKEIEASYPGTLLDVNLEYEDLKLIYEIEILDSKHVVQEIKVDATTGKILTVETD